MCNIIDGKCDKADKYPDNPYHNDPSLLYQVDGELIDFHSAVKKLSVNDPEYGYKVHAIRMRSTKRIIEICAKMSEPKLATSWWTKKEA